MKRIRVTIKENSLLARIAAWQLRTHKVAMVLGTTIHLHNTTRQEFLLDKRWVCHEIVHVHQWQKFGFIRFAILYLTESINHGYHNNRFEREAWLKENDENLLNDVSFL